MRITIAKVVFMLCWTGALSILALKPHLSETDQTYSDFALFALVGVGLGSFALGWQSGVFFPPKDRAETRVRDVVLGFSGVIAVAAASFGMMQFGPHLGLSQEWTMSAAVAAMGIGTGIVAIVTVVQRRAR